MTDFVKLRETIERGGAARYHQAAAATGKLFAREQIKLLTDAGSFTEDGRFANARPTACPPTASAPERDDRGRPVAVIAHDFAVKAGSWGKLTCEKHPDPGTADATCSR